LACCLLWTFARGSAPNGFHAFISESTAATVAGRMPRRFQTRIRQRQRGIHLDKQRRQVRPNGSFLAAILLVVPRLSAEAANGAVAGRGPFGFRRSLPGLDAAGCWYCLVLVCLCLGDAVAASERFKVGHLRVLTKVVERSWSRQWKRSGKRGRSREHFRFCFSRGRRLNGASRTCCGDVICGKGRQ
jgi:hypothetical protein